jgi:hypothetical protein
MLRIIAVTALSLNNLAELYRIMGEYAFVLDGLVEHNTELDPRTCYADTHGYTEVVRPPARTSGVWTEQASCARPS